MEAYSTLSVSQQQADRKTNKFLEYYKTVLDKVSFDYKLFAKEYRKAINVLSSEETAALNAWIESSAGLTGSIARPGVSDRIIEPLEFPRQLNS
jgi:hypothetical protein